ncbi:MAG: protein kinase [Myxococcaceae bacterium]|nr:protein kinase [Myxococcaceae bacterium]
MTRLEFILGEQVIPFPAERFIIGSGADCAIVLQGSEVREQHAEVMQETDGTWWVRDIAGSGSVRVDGSATWEGQLTGGSFLSVGDIDLSVRESGDEGSGTMMRRSQSNPAVSLGDESEPDVPTDSSTRSLKSSARPSAVSRSAPTTKQPKRHLDPGDIIDNRYRIVKRLAAGGMGEVYQGEHVELHKPVAIKVMLPELSKDADFVARFKREAIASSRIGQHNITDISDFGRTAENRFYFVMELLDGKTLAQHARDGAMPQRRAANISIQIARALMAAHDRGIVHRDLKPENVMLLQRPGQKDFVKVLDFGIAKVNEGHGAGGLTQIGMVVGTPQYMSPEQASGLPVDARTDIYSLGLILYELVAGRPTFKGETPSVLMAMQMTAAPPPLMPGPIELPVAPELEKLIFHLLQKKPESRPATMHEVVERLEPFTSSSGTYRATGQQPVPGQSQLLPLTATPLPRGGTQQDIQTPGLLPSAGYAAPSSGGTSGVVAAAPGVVAPTAPITMPPEPAPATGGGGKKVALIFVGVVLLAGVMGIAAASFIGGREPDPQPLVVVPPPPPPKPDPVDDKEKEKPPAGPQKLALTFETVPPGAEVYEDDVFVGKSPVSLAREREKVVSLRFELKGYKPLSRKVRFEDGEKSVSFELEKEKRGGSGPGPSNSGKPKPTGLHDDPYSTVKELKDLPD